MLSSISLGKQCWYCTVDRACQQQQMVALVAVLPGDVTWCSEREMALHAVWNIAFAGETYQVCARALPC
jgi:hypothetical protein